MPFPDIVGSGNTLRLPPPAKYLRANFPFFFVIRAVLLEDNTKNVG
jgi:hypothetical protein